ncbi:MAG: CHAT domain-containing protein [Myxococcales bacterium]|nr:CHAT domain-containing protein [Myxococcales bacterium]MCB9714043.1 CHAT domain-containing protein [Myxococcales bacterium]
MRALRHKLSPLIEQGTFTLAVEPAVRATGLVRLLRIHRPDVLHIACHALKDSRGVQVLALEGRGGERDEIDAEELHALLEEAAVRPRVVILEACRSSPIAAQLSELDPERVVVGTREKIEPSASTRFFLSFHGGLAAGQPIADAFAEARRDMELFAPSLWAIPELHGQRNQGERLLSAPPAASTFEIPPSRVEEQVMIAGPLEPASEVYGREAVFNALDQHWFDEGGEAQRASNIVHIHGDAGKGKTAVLARWLDVQAARGWCGASRVFSWSFDPLGRGPCTGDVASFFEQASEFFGGLDPHLRLGAGEASGEGEWLEGLRLARVIRHERALLCLDHLPMLPHQRHDQHDPHEVLTPGLAALLHELDRGHAGLCIVTSRLHGELRLPRAHHLRIGGIDEAAAVELLVDRGIVETRATIEALAASLKDHPMSLALAANALASGRNASSLGRSGGQWSSDPLALSRVSPDGEASWILRLLALRGGSLDRHELRRASGATDLPRGPREWDGVPVERLAALRELRALGLIRITPDHTIELVSSGVMVAIPDEVPPSLLRSAAESESSPAMLAYTMEANRGESRGLRDVPVYRRTLRVALRTGEPRKAFDFYRREICKVDPEPGKDAVPYRQNHLTRKLGAVGDELAILAELFEEDEGGGFGAVLRPELAVLGATERGTLHHHLGLALRHLGRLEEAQPRFVAAYEDYVGESPERAAICANDLAEVLMWRRRLPEAEQWADRAVASAKEANRGPKVSLLDSAATFVCLGTLARVHHLGGRMDDAKEDLAGAVDAVTRHVEEFGGLPGTEGQLFSRPGYYHWCFLLDELECMHVAGESRAELEKAEELGMLLHSAKLWHQQGYIASVSRGLDALARGRLLLRCLRIGLPRPRSLGPHAALRLEEEAFSELGSAVHVFRANQHLWMLPDALSARAETFDRLGDPTSAARDRAEARRCAELMGWPAAWRPS